MKKLMGMLAVCALALSASATKVNWGLTTGSLFNADQITSGTMYLLYSSTASIDWTAFTGQTKFDTATIEAAGFDKTLATFEYSAEKINTISTLTPANTGLTSSKQLFVLCIGDTLSDGSQYIAYSPTAQTVAISTATTTTSKLQASSAFTMVSTSVPEPTSGLLLLLGMAGLALKRKHA